MMMLQYITIHIIFNYINIILITFISSSLTIYITIRCPNASFQVSGLVVLWLLAACSGEYIVRDTVVNK